MEWLQTLLDSSTTPVLTAFLLGLLTAISPCPLATNIAAIGYIGKDIEDRRRVFLNGLLYTAGRIVAYTVLGLVLILIIRQGASMFGIQKFIGTWGELLLGPALIVIGLLMLFSLPWPSARQVVCSTSECSFPCQQLLRWATCYQQSLPLPQPCPYSLSPGCWRSACRRLAGSTAG